MICPIATFQYSTEGLCLQEKCAWYDNIDYHCVIVTIADNLANIHGHARDVFAKAYGLDELEDTENEED